jgi:hypothetical protein
LIAERFLARKLSLRGNLGRIRSGDALSSPGEHSSIQTAIIFQKGSRWWEVKFRVSDEALVSLWDPLLTKLRDLDVGLSFKRVEGPDLEDIGHDISVPDQQE